MLSAIADVSVEVVPLTRTNINQGHPGVFSPGEILDFSEVGRLPETGDNAAIAVRRLERGTLVRVNNRPLVISTTVLEGHRFAVQPINSGQPLLSWGLPFGLASRSILAGEYLCNEKILRALRGRNIDFELPLEPNFTDHRLDFVLQESHFIAGSQVAPAPVGRNFRGFARPDGRGVGTRNYIVLLGTSSRTAPFVRELARRLQPELAGIPNLDGVVPVDHTEGDDLAEENNFELTLRTLAGFMLNPNVAAVLAVDYGNERVNNRALQNFMRDRGYPLHGLRHSFFSIERSFEESIARAGELVRGWVLSVSSDQRQEHSAAHLRLGLQCGGSDAFSGVSANPLLGILSRETVAQGGSANLAETSELIGAESYVLSNVRDLPTARAFLEKVRRFQEWAGWHGHSAEGNPSGGNMFRGLYNISIKSIGAARKKDPQTRLDYVIDFGELMRQPGFYFMDSPGNDLESIAGQVASGCNMILFATGNGSITNFPFVPTIKVMTTTERFRLVRNEMDFNAGRYLEGEDLESLGQEAFEQMLRVASGEPSAGEKAGHSQVQLWRDWRSGPLEPRRQPSRSRTGEPLVSEVRNLDDWPEVAPPAPSVGLILPTSLCSGQIATLIAAQLNRKATGAHGNIKRFAALPHTEGCGNSIGDNEELFLRTMAGYLMHPSVKTALLLEHGCEKTHNDAFRNALTTLGETADRFGWASIQMDGGIERVSGKVLQWFEQANGKSERWINGLSVGLVGLGEMPRPVRNAFLDLAFGVVARGGAAIFSENSQSFRQGLHEIARLQADEPTLAYGQTCRQPGLHMMESPTANVVETITGIAAAGVDLILAHSDTMLVPGNPLVPVLQISSARVREMPWASDVDLVLENDTIDGAAALWRTTRETLEGRQTRSQTLGNIAFQVTRGYFGISL